METYPNRLHRAARLLLACALGALLLAGCGGGGDGGGGGGGETSGLTPQAGYINLERIGYHFHYGAGLGGRYPYTTAAAHVWYAYYPADGGPAGKPLFVMLNGGPGAATGTNLFSMNTAPYTLDAEYLPFGGDRFARNQHSWTAMGNLLYIDPPLTGFSYNTADDVGTDRDLVARAAEIFTRGNLNPYIDAAQVIRVLLRFLKGHPELQAQEVILVAESYGGTRVSVMFNMLLYPDRYLATGSADFHDDGLVAEIRQHLDAVRIPYDKAERQFGKQILIQPQISGKHQDELQGEYYWRKDSIFFDLARATKGFPMETLTVENCPRPIPYLPRIGPAACAAVYFLPKFDRDRYHYDKPANWSDDLEAFAAGSLVQYKTLSTILGKDVDLIPELRAEARVGKSYRYFYTRSFRWEDLPRPEGAEQLAAASPLDASLGTMYGQMASQKSREQSRIQENWPVLQTLEDRYGKLPYWDRYFEEMNLMAYAGFSLDYVWLPWYAFLLSPDLSSKYGDMFLENITRVNTFLTDAQYDFVIHSPSLAGALKLHYEFVRDVEYARGTRTGELGRFVVKYREGAFKAGVTPPDVALHYPHYARSGHAVAAAEPGEFRRDVEAWLKCAAAGC